MVKVETGKKYVLRNGVVVRFIGDIDNGNGEIVALSVPESISEAWIKVGVESCLLIDKKNCTLTGGGYGDGFDVVSEYTEENKHTSTKEDSMSVENLVGELASEFANFVAKKTGSEVVGVMSVRGFKHAVVFGSDEGVEDEDCDCDGCDGCDEDNELENRDDDTFTEDLSFDAENPEKFFLKIVNDRTNEVEVSSANTFEEVVLGNSWRDKLPMWFGNIQEIGRRTAYVFGQLDDGKTEIVTDDEGRVYKVTEDEVSRIG